MIKKKKYTCAVMHNVKAMTLCGTPRRLQSSAAEQQAASIKLNGLVLFMTLSETKRQTAMASETLWDGAALLNLGRRDGEAPIVPSLERVRHRERRSFRVPSIFFITSSTTRPPAELFILWLNKPRTLLLEMLKTITHYSFFISTLVLVVPSNYFFFLI